MMQILFLLKIKNNFLAFLLDLLNQKQIMIWINPHKKLDLNHYMNCLLTYYLPHTCYSIWMLENKKLNYYTLWIHSDQFKGELQLNWERWVQGIKFLEMHCWLLQKNRKQNPRLVRKNNPLMKLKMILKLLIMKRIVWILLKILWLI